MHGMNTPAIVSAVSRSPRREVIGTATAAALEDGVIAGDDIDLRLLPNARDGDGEPRVGLLIPPKPFSATRRAVLLVFATFTAALSEKQARES